ncbi:MAG: hypothetical protein LCI00_16945 [Chloroflexi bacterium]|nr:hypothetical protein [Chloroflexota bacterium]
MTSKLDSIKQRLAGYEAAIGDCRGSDELVAVDSAFMSSVHTDDLRALLAVAESCEKIVNGGDSGGWEWVEVSRKDFDELKAALATLTG